MNSHKRKQKKTNPRQKANVFSVLTYCWTLPTFVKGLRTDLEEEDLFKPLEEHTSNILGNKLEESWQKEQELYRNPSLLRALLRVFGFDLMIFGFVLVFIEVVLKMAQPLALSQLLLYYTAQENKISEKEAFMYGAIIVGAAFVYALIAHWYSLGLQHFGMKVRVACCSLIYRKALRLSTQTMRKTTTGKLVNLISNDVNRFDQAAVHIHSLWFVPIETAIIVYLLYRILGLTSAIGVLFLVLFVPVQVYLGKKIADLRLKTALKTDDRIQLMNEIISGFHVIKMYTWEKQFLKLVGIARRLETDKIRSTSYVRGIMLSFSAFTTRFAIFLTILVYVMLGNALNAEYVFVITSFYNILRQAVTRYYPQGIAQIGEASVSISRLQKFLLTDESPAADETTTRNLSSSMNTNKNRKDTFENNIITLKNVSAKWSAASAGQTLTNVSLSVQRGKFVAITGAVGCGKSSLLQVLLKELPLEAGTMDVKGKISYASQEPWLFAGTIKQNILFGQPMNSERYGTVIRACDLQQDIALLPLGDESAVGERGVTLSGGQKARVSLARTIYNEADIYLLDDPLSAVDAHVGRKLFETCILDILRQKCVILITHQLQYLRDADYIFVMENGRIMSSGTYQELHELGVNLAHPESEMKHQDSLYDAEMDAGFSNQFAAHHKKSFSDVKEHRSSGKISGEVYFSYLRAGGSQFAMALILSTFFLTQVCASSADYFVAYWVNVETGKVGENYTDMQGQPGPYTRAISISVYSGISSCMVVLTLIRSMLFFSYCIKSSIKLHNQMFSNIIYTTVSFFNIHSSGRILNRFSRDMGSVDETLPSVVVDCIQIGLAVVGVTVVISLAKPWLLGATSIILAIFYSFRVVYLSTSRSVKRLEAITRSPIFTHMNASLQGLTTLRAFGAQEVLQREFDDHQDLHSSCWYLFLSCTRAFGFWLDMICVGYIGVVTFSFLFTNTEEYGGNAGLAITQAISLTGAFQWVMRQWSELENQMTAVERVVEYTKIEREPQRVGIIPAENWPNEGSISFVSVSLRYSPAHPYVLKQLNFSVKARQKIGIVGRTGAGKSSLIYALFQMTETKGAILIDDVDITKVPLETLRSKIFIIPQETVLFSGTLRTNLDLFDQYTDADLWNALEEVEMKDVVAALPSGLNNEISEGGKNFSQGQRQLLCLARAVLRKNKILLLDEATANLDEQTDALIQKTIRRKFSDCTVLTIAHRLNTVMDSDKVLVMDHGSVVEFDHPYMLLKNESGMFYAMVQQLGKSVAESLLKISEGSYNAKFLTEK